MPMLAQRRFADRFAVEQTALARSFRGRCSEQERRDLASLLLHRLMFLRFLPKENEPPGLSRRSGGDKPRRSWTYDPRLTGFFVVPAPTAVKIPDTAFERLYAFFEEYDWSLAETDMPAEDRLTPAVIGPLFEKHVNRKEQGAYYTKDDVTAYLASRTIIPFLLETIDPLPWHLLAVDPERYIPDPLRESGFLATETERDQQARRRRCEGLRSHLRSGEVRSVNELVTLNLDLERFAADVVAALDEETCRKSFDPALRSITVLDPTCGSGAFLLAALRVLERLWLAAGRSRRQARRHIVRHNLFGVDRMPEAVELCRMRLLLELAATAENETDLDDPAALVAGIRLGNVFDDFPRPAEGFDVIVGNPPYLPAAERLRSGPVAEYQTANCPDVYAWVLERSAQLLRSGGRCGMIVPLSLGFSAAFESCRALLFAVYGVNWFASFGRIPAALFAGDIRVRNTIHMGHKTEARGSQYTTRLHRWFEAERPYLLQTLQYVPFDPNCWRQRVPKLNAPDLAGALEDCLRRTPDRQSPKRKRGMTASLAYASGSEKTPHVLHYKKTAYNWLTFCRRLPPCFDAADRPAEQTQFDVLHFADAEQRDLAFLLLNGKWAFAYWAIVGDDFHVARWMFGDFPIDLRRLPAALVAQLRPIAQELEDAMNAATSFKRNAGKRVGTYTLARCRQVTDRSDRLFAEALGLANVWDDLEGFIRQLVKTDFGIAGPFDGVRSRAESDSRSLTSKV